MRSTNLFTWMIQMISAAVLKFVETIIYTFVELSSAGKYVMNQIIGKAIKQTTSAKIWMYAEFSRWHIDTNRSISYTMN